MNDTLDLSNVLKGTGVISTAVGPKHLLDVNPDEGTIVGCLNSNDNIYHRSTSKNWTEQSYGNLPYERLEGVTIENLLTKTHLDWQVNKVPLYTEVGDSKILVPDYYGTLREDTNEVLGIVKSRYEVLQNSQLVDAVTPFMEIEDLCLESGGYFSDNKNNRAGHKVYIQFKLPNYITVNGDPTETMLFISNSHDGTSGVFIGLTCVRTVCRNTFQMNLNSASIRIRHTATMNDKVIQAYKTLNIANQLTTQLNDIFNQMSSVSVNTKQINEVLTLVATPEYKQKGKENEEQSTRINNIVADMSEWVEKEFNSSPALNGNMYGLWNGITAYYNHGVNFRKSDRFNQIIMGTSAKKMDKAFGILTKTLA